MTWVPSGAWMMIVPPDGPDRTRADQVCADLLRPVFAKFPELKEAPPFSTELPADPREASAQLRRLHDTEIVIVLADAGAELLYYAGARDTLADQLTVAVSSSSLSSSVTALFDGRVVTLDSTNAAEAHAALYTIVAADPRRDARRTTSPLRTRLAGVRKLVPGVRVSIAAEPIGKLEQGQTANVREWLVLPKGGGSALDTRVGIWCGDIAAIEASDKIQAIVNSENTYFEMARIHDRSISSIVRYMGSNWSSGGDETDDIIYRDLIERAPAERPVKIAKTVVTRGHRLKDRQGIEWIAHVAAVTPRRKENRPLAGMGYAPVEHIEACVHNALDELDRVRAPKEFTVLMPLLGTGSGGGDARIITRRLINATIAKIRAEPLPASDQYQQPKENGQRLKRIKRVLFLAHTDLDETLCRDALTNASDVVSAA